MKIYVKIFKVTFRNAPPSFKKPQNLIYHVKKIDLSQKNVIYYLLKFIFYNIIIKKIFL